VGAIRAVCLIAVPAYWTRPCGRIGIGFLLFAVDLGATLYLGSLPMTNLRNLGHHHHHHTAIVSAEARGSL
jgi:hypothetical protein